MHTLESKLFDLRDDVGTVLNELEKANYIVNDLYNYFAPIVKNNKECEAFVIKSFDKKRPAVHILCDYIGVLEKKIKTIGETVENLYQATALPEVQFNE